MRTVVRGGEHSFQILHLRRHQLLCSAILGFSTNLAVERGPAIDTLAWIDEAILLREFPCFAMNCLLFVSFCTHTG